MTKSSTAVVVLQQVPYLHAVLGGHQQLLLLLAANLTERNVDDLPPEGAGTAAATVPGVVISAQINRARAQQSNVCLLAYEYCIGACCSAGKLAASSNMLSLSNIAAARQPVHAHAMRQGLRTSDSLSTCCTLTRCYGSMCVPF
jgi:hypothetical protein